MTNHSPVAPKMRRGFFLCTILTVATPALADHVGPGGVGGGGGLSVFGPDTLDAGHWAAGLRILYTQPERRSDAKLEALAERGVDAHNTDYTLNGSLGIAYGVNHHVTLSAELPYLRRDNLREGIEGGIEHLGSVSGFGDLSLLAKYRLTNGERSGFALIAGIKTPTGSTKRRSLRRERLETEHQPGTGSWDPIIGASASTKAGPFRLTASALYQVSTKGAQATKLGDRLQGGIALSHRFGEPPHEHEALHDHHDSDDADDHDNEPRHRSWDAFVELAGEREGRQEVAGEVEDASGGSWVYVAPGIRFTASGWSASAAFAVPVWQHIRPSHPEYRYRMTLSLGRAF